MAKTLRVDVMQRLKHLVEVETDNLFFHSTPTNNKVKNISTCHQLEDHVSDWNLFAISLDPHRVFLKCKHSHHVGMVQFIVDFYFWSY